VKLHLRALYVVSVVAIVQAAEKLVQSFHVPLNDEQANAILVFAALIAGIFLPASPRPPSDPPAGH